MATSTMNRPQASTLNRRPNVTPTKNGKNNKKVLQMYEIFKDGWIVTMGGV